MEPLEGALMRWQRRWVFQPSMRSSAETEPSQPTLPFAWGVFGLHRRNFGERLRSQTCREGSGIGS